MTPATTDLARQLARLSVLSRHNRFEEAEALIRGLPEEVANRAEVVEGKLRYLLHSNQAKRAAGEACKFREWDSHPQSLVEQAMQVLFEAGQAAGAVELATFAKHGQPRISRLATRIKRRDVEERIARLKSEGGAAFSGLSPAVVDEDVTLSLIMRSLLEVARENDDSDLLSAGLGHIVAARPDAVQARLMLVSALLRKGDVSRASEIALGFPQQQRDQPKIILSQLRALLRAKRHREAGEIASKLLERNKMDDPSLYRLAMAALLHSGKAREALAFGRRFGGEAGTGAEELLVQAAYEAGERDLAFAIGHEAVASGRDSGALQAQLARIWQDDGDRERAERAWRAAAEADPDNAKALLELAELLIMRGNAAEAASLLERAGVKAPGLARTHLLHARALRELGEHKAAAKAFAQATEAGGEDAELLRQSSAALKRVGALDEATELFERSLNVREKHLPDSFADGLARISMQIDSVDLPQKRFDWAWKLRGDANDMPREEWELRAKWGYLADRFLFDWLEVRSDRADEAMQIFANLDELEKWRDEFNNEERGLMFAAAHVGPLFAGPLAIELLDVPAKWLASTPALGAAIYNDLLISTSDQGEAAVVRQMVQTLREGKALGLAVDGAPALSAPRIAFEGEEITYSAVPSRIAYRHNLLCYYAAPRWSGRSLRIGLHRMPDPEPDETVDSFSARWREAYLHRVREELRGAPENLRMSGGIWRHIR